MDENVLLSQKKGSVCTLILNRPEKRNSLSQDLILDLYHAFQELSQDDSVRAVVLRGAGEEAFCSGYDILSLPTKATPELEEKLKDHALMELAFRSLLEYPYPIIAMMRGMAFGAGCELSICCDLRVGGEGLRVGMPPVKLGLIYHWAGLHRFLQTIGLRNTKEIFFTGRTYKGSQLLEKGLVDYLVPEAELESFTYGLAEEIAANAPLALKGTKKILNLLMDNTALSEKAAIEAEAIEIEGLGSEDLWEGQKAFAEKRKPQFKGR